MSCYGWRRPSISCPRTFSARRSCAPRASRSDARRTRQTSARIPVRESGGWSTDRRWASAAERLLSRPVCPRGNPAGIAPQWRRLGRGARAGRGRRPSGGHARDGRRAARGRRLTIERLRAEGVACGDGLWGQAVRRAASGAHWESTGSTQSIARGQAGGCSNGAETPPAAGDHGRRRNQRCSGSGAGGPRHRDGSRGGDGSSETADVVITVDRIDRVADAVHAGHRSVSIARQSVLAGMGLSIVAMGFAAAGYLPRWPAPCFRRPSTWR